MTPFAKFVLFGLIGWAIYGAVVGALTQNPQASNDRQPPPAAKVAGYEELMLVFPCSR
jgi:hypothetical protein